MRGTITFLFPALCMALAALAQVPCKWTVDLARVTPADWDCLRGETVELMPSFVSGRDVRDLSGVESATLWWQTNGMGAAYWSRPASVDTNSRPHRLVARWTPEMDCGAAAYRYFVGAAAPSGTQYRAHGTIRMRGAPGAAPNALPLPVPVLDFAKIAWTNEPWSGSSGLTTNDVRAIVAGEGAVRTNAAGMVEGLLALEALDVAGHSLYSDSTVFFYGDWDQTFDPSFELAVKGDIAALADVARSGDYGDLSNAPDLGTAAYRDASEFATAADEALFYQLMMGSNVVAEVTNYNSRVRAPSFRLLQLDPDTKEYVTVWSETNGLSRTLNEAMAYTDAATNALGMAKADRAWSRTTSGLGADAPSNTTWVSTPVTVIAGGYEYAKVITTAGEAWVLCSNGMSAGPDTNAYFRVATLDGESLFSVERSDSVLIGVRAGGITCSGNTVSIPLDVVSAEAPVCYACDDLVSQNWVNLSESLPSWVTSATAGGSAGSWVWTIETTAPKGFFQFRALQEGRTVIRNNAPAELSQGIWVNGSRYVPVANGSTLTWTLAQ